MTKLLILIILFSQNVWSTLRCENLFNSEVYSKKPNQLMDLQFQETQNLDLENVKQLNDKTLHDVINTVPPENSKRTTSLPYRLTQKLLEITDNHQVIGWKASRRYDRPNVEIGFCFGRATYLHLLLLKMGLQKESIRKVWAVGPATTNLPNVVWGFHVAIMVYTKELGWVVIDTNLSEPMTYRDWTQKYSSVNTDGKMRFYITEPEKFGVNTGPYSKLDLGLTLDKANDWYNHYFVDMLNAFRHEKLSDLGLTKLVKTDNNSDDLDLIKWTNNAAKEFYIQLVSLFK